MTFSIERRPVLVTRLSKEGHGACRIDQAPEHSSITNWMFEQAEYRPNDLLRFDGHFLILRGINGTWRYEVDREDQNAYVRGHMHMRLVSYEPAEVSLPQVEEVVTRI